MAIIFKIQKMTIRDCVATKYKIIWLIQLKWKLFDVIEGVTLQEKISKEHVLICGIQVDSCPFPYSLDIGWTKLYRV